MKTAKDYLYTPLNDDSTPFGGKSFSNEELIDFLDSVGLSYDTPMIEVNKILKENGIEPIKY